MSAAPRTQRLVLAALALAAFALRAALRLHDGARSFWLNGYTFYFDLARNLAAGRGLSFDGGTPTAFRVPLYPLFVAAVTRGERSFVLLVLAQSLIGALTVLCGALLAAELFGASAALLTAAMLAVYPYYVVHDTALQETSLFTLLVALAVLLLVRARRGRSPVLSLAAGAALAAAVLTRATLAPFACIAPLWLFAATQAQLKARLRCAALCAGALALGLSPWLAYSNAITGAPSLGTETGYMLWRGNNPHTFSRYPLGSMDESAAVALDAMSERERAELERASDGGPSATNDWFLQRGLAFMREDPLRALSAGARKLGAAFGVLPSPRHALWQNLFYALSYGPVLLLAAYGVVLTRKQARDHGLIYALFLSFAAVTAVFFGHTSHRAFLDVYLVAYASVPIERYLQRAPALA